AVDGHALAAHVDDVAVAGYLLEHRAALIELGPALIGVGDLGVLAESYLAAIGRDLAADHPEERRLPRAVRPHDADAVALLEEERQAGDELAAAHRLVRVFELED